MIHRLFLGLQYTYIHLSQTKFKTSSKSQSEELCQLKCVNLTFLGPACLVASHTTRAEKLPEGLEEQVESTIIDPIARLRESFEFSRLKSEPN